MVTVLDQELDQLHIHIGGDSLATAFIAERPRVELVDEEAVLSQGGNLVLVEDPLPWSRRLMG